MRRIFSFLIVLVLIFSLSVSVFAASSITEENVKLSRSELIDLACDTFPEYATKITTFPASAVAQNAAETPSVIYTETRNVSTNETITYTEFSDGVTSIIYNKAWYETASSDNGVITTVTGDFSCMCNLSLEELYVADFQYCINSSGYDAINSYGTDILSDCTIVNTYKQKWEKASSDAYLEYRVLFAPYPYLEELGYASHAAIIRFEVGDDSFSVTVNGS